MKLRLTGRLVLAVTALIVAILCLLRLFGPALIVGLAGCLAALAVMLIRRGSKTLRETAEKAAKDAENGASPEDGTE